MPEKSTQRVAAEYNFMKVQTQSLARYRILYEADSIAQQRNTNMARQKQQRLEKEEHRQAALAPPPPKKRNRPA